jgi:hypothetical protein
MSVVFDSETRLIVSLRITVLFRFLNLAQVGSQTCVMILYQHPFYPTCPYIYLPFACFMNSCNLCQEMVLSIIHHDTVPRAES